MSESFELDPDGRDLVPTEGRRVLVTGAAGRIGSRFAERLHRRYRLRLMVHPDERDLAAIDGFGEIVRADLADLDACGRCCAGMDSVVHLAASASAESVWSDLLQNNIVGAYNAFVAARSAGCRRLVFASSIHAVSGYPADHQVHPEDPVNPGDLYGVSKCFGEAMARFMAVQQGLSCVVVRIGAFQPPEAARDDVDLSMAHAFVAEDDLIGLLVRCIERDGLRFAIVHGLSDNGFNRMDIGTTRELLGYRPVHRYDQLNRRLTEAGISLHLKPHSERAGQRSGLRNDL